LGLLILRSSGVAQATITGLDWNGDPAGRRQLKWTAPPFYPMTYLWRIYQRNQITRSPNDRYYTTFFYGNDGAFDWGAGYGESYYGAHPYPVTAPSGDGKWEVSADANDFVTRDDASSSYVTNDQWYRQAFRIYNPSGTNFEHKFWIDLPSTATSNTITHTGTLARVTPPSPIVCVGQAPDNGSGLSWGGYTDWEEQNAIIRGWQMYNANVSEADIVTLSAANTDAEALSSASSLGLTPWYINMNWTVADTTDKSGAGNDPSWAGSERPTLWNE
jgi:hypothetical protein